MATLYENELESEFEQEMHENELESLHEGEGENFLGGIGNILGGLLGEGESELEGELEAEGEFEHELEGEFEAEGEFEFENGEQFLGGLGKFFKKALPVLKSIAKVAAPIVGTAIGGPLGGKLGGMAASLLKEHELEGEGEFELEGEFEFEMEGEQEVAHEIVSHEMTMHEALGEMMAEAAAQETHGGQAEGMVGAAVVTVLSPRDRRALSRLLPHLVKGACVLTRILRRRRETRPFVRAVPTIMRRTVRSLKKQAAAGKPITRRAAARAATGQVRRVLGSPTAARAAMARNSRASRTVGGGGASRRHRAVAG
jgi:hypothetical protein